MVAKEACRTIAILSQSLGANFHCLLDLWLPKILKQTGQKIQVISSNADKCIRVTISANCTCGYPKLFSIVLDSLNNCKVASIRRCCVEYSCLACVLWPLDVIER